MYPVLPILGFLYFMGFVVLLLELVTGPYDPVESKTEFVAIFLLSVLWPATGGLMICIKLGRGL